MWKEITAAFSAGLISFLSPCVLPLVPAYISYISGVSVEELAGARSPAVLRRTFLRSLCFVLGFSAVFIAGGAVASSIGQLLAANQRVLMKIAGAAIVVLGLHMTGILRIRRLYTEKRLHVRLRRVGPAGAFLIGMLFAFGWTPCVGPPLAAILTLAGASDTMARGIVLLAVYSLGLGIPFLIAGFATGSALKAIRTFGKHYRRVEITGGLLLILIGVLIFAGSLQSTSFRVEQWFRGLLH